MPNETIRDVHDSTRGLEIRKLHEKTTDILIRPSPTGARPAAAWLRVQLKGSERGDLPGWLSKLAHDIFRSKKSDYHGIVVLAHNPTLRRAVVFRVNKHDDYPLQYIAGAPVCIDYADIVETLREKWRQYGSRLPPDLNESEATSPNQLTEERMRDSFRQALKRYAFSLEEAEEFGQIDYTLCIKKAKTTPLQES